jgi:hypothetical protein
MKIPEKCSLFQTSAWAQCMFFRHYVLFHTVNPYYNGQNIDLHNHKFLWMVMHHKGFAVRKLLYIKRKKKEVQYKTVYAITLFSAQDG